MLQIILASLLALFSAGCAPSLKLSDFDYLPNQTPLKHLSIAHRGSLHNGLPDNSIPALKESLSKGVKFLEVDVRIDQDGKLFIFHDGSLKPSNFNSPRELTGRAVKDLSSAERSMVRLDQESKIGIPSLKEALATLKPYSTASLQIDLKGESDHLLIAVIDLLKQEGALDSAIIQLKSPARIKMIRQKEPAARILARVKNIEQLKQAIDSRVEFVELERWISADAVRLAHAANILVVFNVAAPQYDKYETWKFFRSKGVDSIMTDHADLAARP